MKLVVINFKNRRFAGGAAKILLILVLTISISVGVVSKLLRDEIFIYSNAAVDKNSIVVIDAGHGGEDSGAIGSTGVLEKDLNLEIASEIGHQLVERGYIVVYTRTDDRLLYTDEENIKGIRKISDLKNRCKIALRYPDSVFVSVHMNSYGDAKYSGLQVYYSENNEGSARLAQQIQNKVRNELQPENTRQTKNGDGLYVLENVKNPAVLIECGFLSNVEECEKLSEKEYQKSLSFSIVCGIIEYIEAN